MKMSLYLPKTSLNDWFDVKTGNPSNTDYNTDLSIPPVGVILTEICIFSKVFDKSL